MRVIVKYVSNKMNYYVRYSGNVFQLGYINFQNMHQKKIEMIKQIYKESEDYDLGNFIRSLGLIKQIRYHNGITYEQTTEMIKRVLHGQEKQE
ncbi:MAG: hypothetical protein QXV17_09920 [Candidatus Micrarchaeaceae archaeon]